MDRLGLEMLTVCGLPPVRHVELAASLGCECVSLPLASTRYNPYGYAPFSLRDDAALRRETRAALADLGIAVSLGHSFLRPGFHAVDMARDMDVFAQIGCERMNTLSIDRDPARRLDELATFAEMAAERGMASAIEFVPMLPIGSLDQALALVAKVGRPDFGLSLDAMHLRRSGVTARRLAEIDPAAIANFQISDVPDSLDTAQFMYASEYERLVPGEGDVPLADYLAALPTGMTFGLEIPCRSEAEAGIDPVARIRRCVDAARALLSASKAARSGSGALQAA